MAASISFQGAQTQSGSSSSYTLTFTAASAVGQERLVVILGIAQNHGTTTFGNVTIDGQAATQVASHVHVHDGGGSPAGPIVSFWRAVGTAATSVDVDFDVTAGAMFDARGALWSLTNAGSLYDSTAATLTKPVVADLSLDVDTVTDGVVAAATMQYNSPTTVVAWTGLTERYDGKTEALYSGLDWFSVADLNVSSGSTPLTITVDEPSDFGGQPVEGVAGLVVSFNPAVVANAIPAFMHQYRQRRM